MLSVIKWSFTCHKHSFFIALHMNDGLISIIIFWGQGFMLKHRLTPFLWDFIHALSIAKLIDKVQHSFIRMKRWRIAPCLLIWGITLKVNCALLPYLRISNFGINKIHLFSSRIDWLFRQSTSATMLCWFEREKHQLRVPIRHINSCQIHILDMVIGSMYSRASSASQS